MDIARTFMDEPEIVDFGYVDPDPSRGMGAMFDAMPLVLVAFAVLFVAVLGFMVWIFVRNHRAARKAGLDPFTLHTDLAARAANSALFAPRQSCGQRLADLDDLLARRVITPEEHRQARLKILTDE